VASAAGRNVHRFWRAELDQLAAAFPEQVSLVAGQVAN
jgi:hypothetical protein